MTDHKIIFDGFRHTIMILRKKNVLFDFLGVYLFTFRNFDRYSNEKVNRNNAYEQLQPYAMHWCEREENLCHEFLLLCMCTRLCVLVCAVQRRRDLGHVMCESERNTYTPWALALPSLITFD